jgi:hypothetical protein
MAKADKHFLGDRNTIRLLRGRSHRGYFVGSGALIEADRVEAEHLLPEGLGELVSIEFSKPLKMTGAPIGHRFKTK